MGRETDEHDLRSYGRRRGRKPSPRQAALLEHELPRVALSLSDPPPARLGELFAPPVDEVWLEIGFGGGEHLLWQARANPHVGLIGCEPFEDGVVKALSAIERREARQHPPACRRRPPAAALAAATHRSPAPSSCFPTPGPRSATTSAGWSRPRRWRELARVMRPGAELRIATDIGDYARWILLAVARTAQFQLDRRGPARLARARRRLASDPLRAKSPARGPALRLFPVPASVMRTAPCPATNLALPACKPRKFLPNICSLMIISTLRVGPWGPLFLFWAIG